MRDQYNAANVGAGGTRGQGWGPGNPDWEQAQRQATVGGGAPRPAPGGGGGGWGGGGGGGPAPVDPYAWMADFGGPAIFKAFLRTPGERVQDYYKRHGGDPLKTILEVPGNQGYAPTTELRSMMVGALDGAVRLTR